MSGAPMRRPIPAIYYCAGPLCVTRREGPRKVGRPGALCPACGPNRVHARSEDLRAQTRGHTPNPAKARAHPVPVGTLTPKVGPVDWAALGALAPEERGS